MIAEGADKLTNTTHLELGIHQLLYIQSECGEW